MHAARCTGSFESHWGELQRDGLSREEEKNLRNEVLKTAPVERNRYRVRCQ
jgi:hypothetical protein